MKPIKEEMLAEAVSKFERLSVNADFGNLQKVLDALTQSRDSSYRERFLVTKADRLLVLQTSDVAFFYSENRHTYAVTSKGTAYQIGMTLDNLVRELDPRLFHVQGLAQLLTFRIIRKNTP